MKYNNSKNGNINHFKSNEWRLSKKKKEKHETSNNKKQFKICGVAWKSWCGAEEVFAAFALM